MTTCLPKCQGVHKAPDFSEAKGFGKTSLKQTQKHKYKYTWRTDTNHCGSHKAFPTFSVLLQVNTLVDVGEGANTV